MRPEKFKTAYSAVLYLGGEWQTPFELELDVYHEAMPGGVFALYLTPKQARELGEALLTKAALQEYRRAR